MIGAAGEMRVMGAAAGRARLVGEGGHGDGRVGCTLRFRGWGVGAAAAAAVNDGPPSCCSGMVDRSALHNGAGRLWRSEGDAEAEPP